MSVEEDLWNIFTFYSLHGNQKDPSRLNRSSLYKICREVMVLDMTMTENPISQADIDLIFTSELQSPEKKRASRQEKSDRLDYDEFLSCLIRIAEKCYPSCKNSEAAFQQLLMDNVLPLASRRKPMDITPFVQNSVVVALYQYYEEALFELYRYFATASDHNTKVRNMIRSTTSHAKTFDEQKEQILEAREVSRQQHATASLMCYNDFFRFAADFGLSSMGLTTLDLGDIYLSVIQSHNFEPDVRKIDFAEFWEALVRCALRAFTDSKIPTDEKIKGMFLYVWRFIQSSIQEEISGIGTVKKGGFNTYKGGLLRGSQILNERFIAAWTKDGYKDYLDEAVSQFFPFPLCICSLLAPQKSPSRSKPHSAVLPSNRITQGSVMERTLALAFDDMGEASANTREIVGFADAMPSKGRSSSTPFHSAAPLKPPIILDIQETEHLGDDRIKPSQLRQLLLLRPDISTLLKECIDDEGLAELSSDDEN
jgi:hypothetical protein